MTVRPMYPNNPASIALRVPLDGFAAVNDAIPELKAHLRARYPKLRGVEVKFRNPIPPMDTSNWRHLTYATYLHDASLMLMFTGKAIATAVIAEVSREAIKFLKKRVPKLKAGPASKRSDTRKKRGSIKKKNN